MEVTNTRILNCQIFSSIRIRFSNFVYDKILCALTNDRVWRFLTIFAYFLGSLNEDYLRELLTTLGDRFSQDEVDDLYKEAPIKDGQFDYVEFTRILKHGAKDPDDH